MLRISLRASTSILFSGSSGLAGCLGFLQHFDINSTDSPVVPSMLVADPITLVEFVEVEIGDFGVEKENGRSAGARTNKSKTGLQTLRSEANLQAAARRAARSLLRDRCRPSVQFDLTRSIRLLDYPQRSGIPDFLDH
jgi:hypothetical protein